MRFLYLIWLSNKDMRHLFASILTFALLAGSLAAAETCKFQLSEKVQAGQTQLRPGTYSLIVDGPTAVLKDKAGSTIDVKANIEQEPNSASCLNRQEYMRQTAGKGTGRVRTVWP